MYIPEKGTSNRLEKVSKELMRFVSEKLVSGDFYSGLPHKPMITITSVDLAPNMRHAIIYFRNFDANEAEKVLAFLTRISGEVSKLWARNARTKYTPSIEFRFDEHTAKDRHMDDLFDKIRH